MPVRITILYNEPTLPADHPDAESEHDVLETVDIIARHLQSAGLDVSRLGATGDPKSLLAGLNAAKPDAVFNLFEGTAGWGRSEEYVAGLLELLHIPYTGCPTLPMTVCRDKPLAKRLFAGAGIPTTPYAVIPDGPVPVCPLPFPVIVKPGREDASVGIDQKSVCTTQAELNERITYLRQTYGPSVLVERLIVGREFHVPVIERDGQILVLPFTEILFPPPADGEPIWPIVTFDAKWRPNSRDFASTPAKNPAEVDPALHARVCEIVTRTFQLLECRDYARVDLRVDETGQPYVLEMNPNPCINPLAGVAAALESAKIPYAEFLLGCVRNALRRGPRQELADFQTATKTNVVVPPAAPVEIEMGTKDIPLLLSWATADAVMTSGDRAIVSSLFQRPAPAESWVARLNGLTVGGASVICQDAEHSVWAIERIAVDPNHRRNGVGRALLLAIEKWVQAQGGRVLTIGISSSPGWSAVRQFLPAVGFSPVGECPEYYRDGCSRLEFAKSLPAVLESPPLGAAESNAVGRAFTGGGLL